MQREFYLTKLSSQNVSSIAFSYTAFTIGKAYRRSQYVSAALLMPSPAKPTVCSTAFSNAQTNRQSKQKLKLRSSHSYNYTRVIFSQSFTKITTFIAYLHEPRNAEHKLTAAKPTTDDADWFVWLAQPISDAAGCHVTSSSLFLAAVSAGQCREEVPGCAEAWNVLFCFQDTPQASLNNYVIEFGIPRPCRFDL